MIFVCNLHEMPTHVGVLRQSHLVSLVTSIEQPPTPDGILIQRHLRIEIDPLLIHCVAGISRSMASALIALVLKAGGREIEAAQCIRAAHHMLIRTAASSRSPTRSSD
jgi:predicted protein tyrosine phosphatase